MCVSAQKFAKCVLISVTAVSVFAGVTPGKFYIKVVSSDTRLQNVMEEYLRASKSGEGKFDFINERRLRRGREPMEFDLKLCQVVRNQLQKAAETYPVKTKGGTTYLLLASCLNITSNSAGTGYKLRCERGIKFVCCDKALRLDVSDEIIMCGVSSKKFNTTNLDEIEMDSQPDLKAKKKIHKRERDKNRPSEPYLEFGPVITLL